MNEKGVITACNPLNQVHLILLESANVFVSREKLTLIK